MLPPRLVAPPPPTAAERVGALLRRERQAHRLSQQTLADRLGIHQSALARWELGRRSPTLAQIDEALGWFDLRLRLEVEPIPDANRRWDQEATRLASMTPAQRLCDYPNGLADLMETAGTLGAVDGQTAAQLQGVPGAARWMGIATTPEHVHDWLTLEWISQGAVDAGRQSLPITKAEAAAEFLRDGEGHVKTVYGFVELRIVEALPPTVELCLREAGEDGDRVLAPVIGLSALAAHWQQPTP